MVDLAVKKIRPADADLSTIQDNLANAIQQLLDFANGAQPKQSVLAPVMQQLRGPGTAYSVKAPALLVHGRPDGTAVSLQPTVQIGDPQTVSPTGQVNLQRDGSLFTYGQIVATGSRGGQDGMVLIPMSAGAAFRVTSINNAANVFTVSDTGQVFVSGSFQVNGATTAASVSATTVAASTVSSAQGFKTWLPGGHYWVNGYPGGVVPVYFPLAMPSGNVCTAVPWSQPVVRAGSLTALTVTHFNTTNFTCAVTVNKNGALLVNVAVSVNASNGQKTFPKGQYTFAAGDTLTLQIGYSVGGINISSYVGIEIETGA